MKKYLCIVLLAIGCSNLFAQQKAVPTVPSDDPKFTEESEIRRNLARYDERMQKRVHKKALFFRGHDDALNIWFDINKIERFIDSAKKLTDKAGTTLSGVRFYYAVYPKSHPKEGYTLSHTLYMVPTESWVNPENNKDTVEVDIIRKDGSGTLKILTFKLLERADDDPVNMNNGVLCPPLERRYCEGSFLRQGIEIFNQFLSKLAKPK